MDLVTPDESGEDGRVLSRKSSQLVEEPKHTSLGDSQDGRYCIRILGVARVYYNAVQDDLIHLSVVKYTVLEYLLCQQIRWPGGGGLDIQVATFQRLYSIYPLVGSVEATR